MSTPELSVKILCHHCNGKGYIFIGRLESLRKEAELSQADVAIELGLTRSSISNMELGKQAISVEKIPILARLYKIDEHEMYDILKSIKVKE